MAKKGKIHISKNSKKAESKSCGKTFNYCMPCGKQLHYFLKLYVSIFGKKRSETVRISCKISYFL